MDSVPERLVTDNLPLAKWFIKTRYARVVRDDPDRFDELFQTACEGLTLAAKAWRQELGAFSSFACVKMRGRISTFLRRRPFRRDEEIGLSEAKNELIEFPEEENDPEISDELAAALSLLTPMERSALLLRADRVNRCKIAEQLSVTPNQVRSLLNSAKKKLRRELYECPNTRLHA